MLFLDTDFNFSTCYSKKYLIQKEMLNARALKVAHGFSTNVKTKHPLASKFSNVDEVKELWKKTDAVCFDVDSTVITGEGIDVLAAHCGKAKEVAEWTKNAMSGNVPFHVALEERLKLFTPSKQQIAACNAKHTLTLTPKIKDLISTLHGLKKEVFFVSGGFRQMIDPHANEVGIPADKIFANNLLFDTTGKYVGFDVNEPTSRAGGKAKVVGMLKDKHKFKTMAMIGDGFTDLEARPPADLFIGFGGIAVRQVVKDNADWFVLDFDELVRPLKK